MAQDGTKQPTASEAMFFFTIVKHMKNKAEIDWPTVAEEMSFKNADVAKVRFGQVRRKLGLGALGSPEKKPANGTGVKKSPAKRPKKEAGSVKKVKKSESDDDDDLDDEVSDHRVKGEQKEQQKEMAQTRDSEDPF